MRKCFKLSERLACAYEQSMPNPAYPVKDLQITTHKKSNPGTLFL